MYNGYENEFARKVSQAFGTGMVAVEEKWLQDHPAPQDADIIAHMLATGLTDEFYSDSMAATAAIELLSRDDVVDLRMKRVNLTVLCTVEFTEGTVVSAVLSPHCATYTVIYPSGVVIVESSQ